MNVLVINGSPRRNGNITRMLSAMEDEVTLKQNEVISLWISDLQVKPCTGCMSCRKSGTCVLPEDDAQKVLRLIQACDLLIVGAPCYWGNMPGQLKVLFDRLVYGMMGEDKRGIPKPLHKGKKAILITTCTTPFPFNIIFHQSRGTVRALKEILKWSGFKIISAIEFAGTKQRFVDERVLKRCRKTINRLSGKQ